MTQPTYATVFAGDSLVTAGPLSDVTLFLAGSARLAHPVLVFDDATGKVIDLDLRGSTEEILARLEPPASGHELTRSVGRPRLGVVAREVTLLPQHWEWLGRQRGGASATLRRLVEGARKSGGVEDAQRVAEERTYKFIVALAGNLPGFEEASRALFAHDRAQFAARIAAWPVDVRDYAMRLLG
jgi:hypothetical protein